MQFKGEFKLKSTDELLKERGLQEMGKVQKFVDSEVIKKMAPYTPMLSGVLEKSPILSTVIGSGNVEQNVPHGRFQYYGKLMVSSVTGSAWARSGESKVLTDTDLVYNTSRHPLAGKMWFERMKADKKEEILKGARKIAGAK